MAMAMRRAVSNLVGLAIVVTIVASMGMYIYSQLVESYASARSSIEVVKPIAIARCWYLKNVWVCGVRAITPISGFLKVLTVNGKVIEIGRVSMDSGSVKLFRLSMDVGDAPAKLVLVTGRDVVVFSIER